MEVETVAEADAETEAEVEVGTEAEVEAVLTEPGRLPLADLERTRSTTSCLTLGEVVWKQK